MKLFRNKLKKIVILEFSLLIICMLAISGYYFYNTRKSNTKSDIGSKIDLGILNFLTPEEKDQTENEKKTEDANTDTIKKESETSTGNIKTDVDNKTEEIPPPPPPVLPPGTIKPN